MIIYLRYFQTRPQTGSFIFLAKVDSHSNVIGIRRKSYRMKTKGMQMVTALRSSHMACPQQPRVNLLAASIKEAMGPSVLLGQASMLVL